MTRTIETWECVIGHQFEKPRGYVPETEPDAEGSATRQAVDITCPICHKRAKLIHSRVTSRA